MTVLLLMLLFIPLQLELQANVTLWGGHLRITAHWLFFRINVPVRVYLLEKPYLCLDVLKKDGSVRRRIPIDLQIKDFTPGERTLLNTVQMKALEGELILGISGRVLATAAFSGLVAAVLNSAAALLLPEGKRNVVVTPVWDQTVCRLNLEGILLLRPVNIIKERILKQEKE